MAWNDAKERAKFEAQQKRQAEEYRKKGIRNKDIKAMYEFDLVVYKLNRSHHTRTQALILEESCDEEFEIHSELLGRFLKSFTVTDDDSLYHSRYWWVEEIDNPELARKLKMLSKNDLELLTLFVFDGYTQEEIAEKYGTTKQNINKKIKRIKIFLSCG